MVQSVSKIIEGMKIKPVRTWKLSYNSSSETLEPLYFCLLDFMNTFGDVEKLVDTFTSSPGSGHFSELMGKGTRMQEEAMKIYGMVNTVMKSIINLIYDLKEFQLRLKNYDDANSSNPQEAASGSLSLKQIWMDTVDIKRGRGAINMMAQDLQFVTLRDAFMAVNTLKGVDKVDLNERVKTHSDEFTNDVIVHFDRIDLTDKEKLNFFLQLPDILKDSGEIGKMEYDIFKLDIKELFRYEEDLMICER